MLWYLTFLHSLPISLFKMVFVSNLKIVLITISKIRSGINFQSSRAGLSYPAWVLTDIRSFPSAQQFSFRSVEQCEIENIILSMPTGRASGADKIPLRVIQDCLPNVLPSLTSIINTCFTTETFPTLWKIVEVTPILKSGDHEEVNKNRLISLLLILSKICEDQFLPYLVSNDRLTTKQSGNKRFHSTETALIHTTDFILNAMDKKKTTAMRKAFDSINHGILLNKLQHVGASNSALQWFHSYLSNGSQTVRIHSVISDPLPMVNGVPQGSILGPILFSIYINDLPKIPRSCSTDCYVDDTKLYMCFPVQDYQSAPTEINDLI